MPVILSSCEAEIGRIKIQGQQRQIVYKYPFPEITEKKWTGGMALEVYHLPSKQEALSSNYSPTKKKKRERAGRW
jgi:hypothetical protein